MYVCTYSSCLHRARWNSHQFHHTRRNPEYIGCSHHQSSRNSHADKMLMGKYYIQPVYRNARGRLYESKLFCVYIHNNSSSYTSSLRLSVGGLINRVTYAKAIIIPTWCLLPETQQNSDNQKKLHDDRTRQFNKFPSECWVWFFTPWHEYNFMEHETQCAYEVRYILRFDLIKKIVLKRLEATNHPL